MSSSETKNGTGEMNLSRRKFLGAVSATAVAAVVPVDVPAASAQELIDAGMMAEFPGFLAQTQAWLPCDGRELPISEFKKLYDMIGMSYGGDINRQTFNLPGEPLKPKPIIPDGASWVVPKISTGTDDQYPTGMIMMMGDSHG